MASVLLYDGTCGVCAASVQFVLRHERRHSLQFAALDGEFGAALRRSHPELAGVDSMLWVEAGPDGATGEVLARSEAVLRVLRYLGGVWSLALLGAVVPRLIRDAAYDLFAKHRHRFVKPPDQCFMPTPDVRARFLP